MNKYYIGMSRKIKDYRIDGSSTDISSRNILDIEKDDYIDYKFEKENRESLNSKSKIKNIIIKK